MGLFQGNQRMAVRGEASRVASANRVRAATIRVER
jgi:hypothetical protein